MSPKRRSRSKASAFWGDASRAPSGREAIRPTPDPAALVRSLGDPPLATPHAAEHLAVVYEEAVRAATALAAANDLLADTPD